MATATQDLLERGEQLRRDGIVIRTYDLWKTYIMGDQEINAVSGVDIQIRRGEYVAIMGPSGSGKSTLMNLIGCLDTASNGLYYLNGKLVSDTSILLADEPTGALDSVTGNEIMALFERLYQQGNTIVLVTHEHDIALHAHRVIHIRDGKVEKDERIK